MCTVEKNLSPCHLQGIWDHMRVKKHYRKFKSIKRRSNSFIADTPGSGRMSPKHIEFWRSFLYKLFQRMPVNRNK